MEKKCVLIFSSAFGCLYEYLYKTSTFSLLVSRAPQHSAKLVRCLPIKSKMEKKKKEEAGGEEIPRDVFDTFAVMAISCLPLVPGDACFR